MRSNTSIFKLLVLGAAAIGFTVTAALAADSAPMPAARPAATLAKADHMAVARDAIKAKDWEKALAEYKAKNQ